MFYECSASLQLHIFMKREKIMKKRVLQNLSAGDARRIALSALQGAEDAAHDG